MEKSQTHSDKIEEERTSNGAVFSWCPCGALRIKKTHKDTHGHTLKNGLFIGYFYGSLA
jgi:hypothetical protein